MNKNNTKSTYYLHSGPVSEPRAFVLEGGDRKHKPAGSFTTIKATSHISLISLQCSRTDGRCVCA